MSGDLSTLLSTFVTLDFGLFSTILHKASKDPVQRKNCSISSTIYRLVHDMT